MVRHCQNTSNRGVYGDEQLQVALQIVKYATPLIRVSKQLGINTTWYHLTGKKQYNY